MRGTLCALTMGLVASLAACSDNAHQRTRVAKPSASSESEPTRPKIEASVKNRAELHELIMSHAGQVVVLDLWALW